ncbi:hypothetical protein AND_006334 [Anopheles darlingi]|uniref:Uncharacterized protein n=1 Tax=Anopheles darlingi TaxID=43151 RepID=W5JGG6_ANODA|nr:hypothetical protein AND_006334 [Anopheles darlingi]
MATIRNVKLPDLINRWIEVQNPESSGTDGATKEPLEVDAINLTLLLKSMGMRLQYLDFDDEKTNTDALTISIKCNRSGIRSELSYDLQQQGCSCPEKTDRDSSFWEVQATGPKVFSKFKNNTSSNLLPDVSERCALVSKAMLANLLDYYQRSIQQVKEGKERALLKSPLKPKDTVVCVTSPGLTMRTPFSTPPAEGRCTARMSLGATREPLLKHDFQDIEADRPDQETKETAESVASSTENGTGVHNLTHDILDADIDNIHKPVIVPVIATNASMPDGESVFNCNEAMKHVITSSPVIRKVPPPAPSLHDTVDMQQERDVNVINHLQQARSQIDMALLMMNQGTTQDMFGGSALTLTPQQNTAIARKSLGTPRFPPVRSGSLLTIERHRPVAEAGEIKKKTFPTTPSALTGRLSIGGRGTTIASRADTPRPSIAQVKAIAGLRRTVTMPPPAAVRQKPVTGASTGTTLGGQRRLLPSSSATSATAKTVVPRQPISFRPVSSSANRQAGLIHRSSSASLLTKK